MEKTGESYEQALRQVRAAEERAPQEKGPRALSVADTAFSIAVVRAEETVFPERERLFDDPYAKIFAAVETHAAEATQRYLDMPFFKDGVRLRTRFIDDEVKKALASGLEQVILLGAGFDARALRLEEIERRRARVFEIDVPDQLELKRSLLRKANVTLPANVAYVPHDFDAAPSFEATLLPALEASGFRRGAGAVVVWEGVIGYIDDAMIDRTMRFVAEAGGPGTRLVFTFGLWTFDPETAATRALRAGFSSCDEVGCDELWRRYLQSEPHANAFAVKLATAVV